jgi:cyclic pyranopterin phosphate synthase
LQLRLIEYMDVGNRNGWCRDQVMPAQEMIQLLHRHWPIQPIGRPVAGTSRQWSYQDGGGIVGTIASISEPFCSDCNRLRITADGQAFTCLFASEGTDLRQWLREDVADSLLQNALSELWSVRSDRFSEQRGLEQPVNHHAEMAYLGG